MVKKSVCVKDDSLMKLLILVPLSFLSLKFYFNVNI